jgi:hypothetical protein
MGWDSALNWNTKADAVKDTTNSIIKSGWTILDHATTRQGAYWLVKRQADDKPFIYCAIVEKRDNQVWIKTMSEDMGPRIVDCPVRLLGHETSLTGYSTVWRESVKAYHANKSRDLTGKLIKLYDKVYHVIGKPTNKRTYLIKNVETGQSYRLTKDQESYCEVLS